MGLCSCVTDCVINQQPQSLSDENSTSLLQSIKQCHTAAEQTVQLCTSTLTTGNDLVDCGESIQRSLLGAASDLDAESFAVIADLIDGDKVREARELAVTMKGKSNECISLSMQMVKALEQSVDALPDIIESYIEKKAQQSITEELSVEEREMADGMDDEMEEISRCIDAIENLNLLTAIEAGTNAFAAIKSKSHMCHRIFEMIQKFATDVTSITDAISNMDASAVLSKVKDGSILKAIGLSKYIKQFAEGCKKIMDKIIELFHGTAGKLSTLWKSLSHAKDVMVDGLTEVVNARSLCGEAGEKVDTLKELTSSIGHVGSLELIKSLSRDRSLNNAMGTARDLDVAVEEAALKMKDAAKMVGDEYDILPGIITDGITDEAEDEVTNNSLTARMKDIDKDIQDLDLASKTIEEADIFHATKIIHKEISNIPGKVDICQEMIQSCSDFTDRSKSSIDSFLGKWSLETAVSQIQQMCHLVSWSKLMMQMADQIHQLIKAITTLLKMIATKIQMVAEQLQSSGVENALDSVVDAAGDLVSDEFSNMMGKLCGK